MTSIEMSEHWTAIWRECFYNTQGKVRKEGKQIKLFKELIARGSSNPQLQSLLTVLAEVLADYQHRFPNKAGYFLWNNMMCISACWLHEPYRRKMFLERDNSPLENYIEAGSPTIQAAGELMDRLRQLLD